jgi:hypothetical protein
MACHDLKEDPERFLYQVPESLCLPHVVQCTVAHLHGTFYHAMSEGLHWTSGFPLVSVEVHEGMVWVCPAREEVLMVKTGDDIERHDSC